MKLWHAKKDLGEPVGTPASPPDIARLEAVAANYGVDILGPRSR
jgi:hypothetical protein